MEIDDFAEIAEDIYMKPASLFNNLETAKSFEQLDIGVLRAKKLSKAVPPPTSGNQKVPAEGVQGVASSSATSIGTPLSTAAAQAEADELPFYCGWIKGDNCVCSQKFASKSALAIHRSHATIGGDHGKRDVPGRRSTVSSQCPICSTSFGSIEYCRRHVQSAIKSGKCGKRQTKFAHEIITDWKGQDKLQCPHCDHQEATLQAMQRHLLAAHLAETGVRAR